MEAMKNICLKNLININYNFTEEFNEIEKIISYNLSKRGLDKVKLTGQLKSSVNLLNNSSTIVIVTGFPIKSALVGETDGPPGALALAYALEKLNKKTIIVTDKYSEQIIKDGAKLLGLQADLIFFEENKEKEQAEKIISEYKPEHIIAIERPGRGINNKCYSMYGEDITCLCPNTDILFVLAKENNIPTSAIGDGGNELGMGKIKEIIKENVNNGDIICAQFETDNLIVAGVSNWGAYGICTGLSLINYRHLMLDYDIYEQLMEIIVKAGAVDGCTKMRETSVDGLSYEENLAVFHSLKELSERKLVLAQ